MSRASSQCIAVVLLLIVITADALVIENNMSVFWAMHKSAQRRIVEGRSFAFLLSSIIFFFFFVVVVC